jgi:hypothetical protein
MEQILRGPERARRGRELHIGHRRLDPERVCGRHPDELGERPVDLGAQPRIHPALSKGSQAAPD